MRVLSVASEVFPLVKTGGLADVVGALPGALAEHGVEMRILVPGYPSVLDALEAPRTLHAYDDLFGAPARLVSGAAAGLDILAVDAPNFFKRDGGPYSDRRGGDWPDNALRFAALSRIAAEIGAGLDAWQPAVVHAHDWLTGLTPAYIHYQAAERRPGSVITVHNLAFQGRFPSDILASLELPTSSLSIDGVEYFGGIGFLKAGLQFADRITTVSPTYAAEIQTDEGGMGLGGLLRARAEVLSGILNGIDETVWNPATDSRLARRFGPEDVGLRNENRRALQERYGPAADPGALLFGMVTRLSWQKGCDLLLAAIPRLLSLGGSLVVLGSGDAELEAGFRAAAAASPDRIGVALDYDEGLAHLIQGGVDALLVPSRFEPCGLTQLCALRYGAVPVVSRVGGLNDTLIDANEAAVAAGVATGFQFAPVTVGGLETVLARAEAVFRDKGSWRRIQENGMRADVGWGRPAARYAEIYRRIASGLR
jgi:starch synthase